jgi:DNA polymerase III subunit epsilon
MSLKLQKPLVFLDLETTGTNILKDRILQIALLKIEPGGEETQYDKLVNPEIPIPALSTEIHGITDPMVKDSPNFKDIAQEVNQFLNNSDLAGYNHIKFDLPLLIEEFDRAEIQFSLQNRRLVDAQRLFFLMEPRNLTAAYRFFCDKELEGAHNAMEDVLATKDVLFAQIERYSGKTPEGWDLPPLSSKIDDLHRYSFGNMVDLAGRLSRDKEGNLTFNFGKNKGRMVKEVFSSEPQYYDWIMRSEFPQDTKRILTNEFLKLRKS